MTNVLDFERLPKQVEVKILYAPWKESEQVAPEDAWALLVIHYEINGHWVPRDVVTLEGGFMFTVHLEVPEDHPEIDEAMNKKNRAYFEESIAAVRDEFTANDWLEETTNEVLVLPISRLELVERSLAKWKAM